MRQKEEILCLHFILIRMTKYRNKKLKYGWVRREKKKGEIKNGMAQRNS